MTQTLNTLTLEQLHALRAELAAKRNRETNMPWAVYRCPLIKPGQSPRDETLVSVHLSPSEAMDEANRMKRADRAHSYTVGAA